jgi:antirestriction protein
VLARSWPEVVVMEGEQRLHDEAPVGPESNERVGRAEPRIYVASLSDYNAGILHGEWLDANQEPDELEAAVDDMLARSTTHGAEEFAVHDYEGFGAYTVGEYESLDWLSRIARGIAEHGAAFAAWAQECGRDDERLARFEDAFLGEWQNVAAYTDELLSDLGYAEVLEQAVPEWLQPYVSLDIEGLARDMELSGDLHTFEHEGGVWVFDGRT